MGQDKKIIIISFIIASIFAFRQTYGAEEAIVQADASGESHKIEYKSENLTDPFRNPLQEQKVEPVEKPKPLEPEEGMPVEVKPLPSLQIQGIIWGSSLPQAVINSKVLKIGDTIEGVQIKDIAKGRITVFFGNREYNLSMPALEVHKGLNKSPERGRYEGGGKYE